MKINPLDAHDRFLAFKQNQAPIAVYIADMIEKRPFGDQCFYIFIIHQHTLGLDEKVSLVQTKQYRSLSDCPEAVMKVQARLSRPEPSPNTTLLKAYPGKEFVKRIWSLPKRELWDQFEKGKMFEDSFIADSILKAKTAKEEMCKLEEEDVHSKDRFLALWKIAKEKEAMGKIRIVEWIPIHAAKEENPEKGFQTT